MNKLYLLRHCLAKSNNKKFSATASLFSILLFALPAFSQSSFTINIAPAKDNTIYERSTSNSNGAGEYFIAGTTGSPYINRALISFNVAGTIPQGAIIRSAVLTLHLAGSSAQAEPYHIELHKLLQNWGEGTSNAGTQAGRGAPATANDATWMSSFYPGTAWTKAGGNFDTILTATQLVDSIGFYSWSSSRMAADLQYWLDNPSANFGWLLKNDEFTSYQAKKFESKENAVIANRPMLTVTYTPANLPPSVVFTSPANEHSFPAGSSISLDVSATDADGTISKVEFYNNGIKFAEDTAAPFSITGNEVEPGIYAVTAKAFDNIGSSSTTDTLKIIVTACIPAGTITGEGYTNIPGGQVADLLTSPAYPNSPSITGNLTSMEYANIADNYGGRLRGYLCAPATGDYTFYISGDDQAGLWLSNSDSTSNKKLVAYTETATAFRQYNKFATQQSKKIRLVKGSRYYIETLHKEATGADHLSVAWRLPNGILEAPISTTRISPYGSTFGRPAFAEAMKTAPQLLDAVKEFTVSIQPNPSHNEFTIITGSNKDDKLMIKIMDVHGRVIERLEHINANGKVQAGRKLIPGVYFAEVVQGNERKMIKLVKQ